jgi:hypothetical protein
MSFIINEEIIKKYDNLKESCESIQNSEISNNTYKTNLKIKDQEIFINNQIFVENEKENVNVNINIIDGLFEKEINYLNGNKSPKINNIDNIFKNENLDFSNRNIDVFENIDNSSRIYNITNSISDNQNLETYIQNSDFFIMKIKKKTIKLNHIKIIVIQEFLLVMKILIFLIFKKIKTKMKMNLRMSIRILF